MIAGNNYLMALESVLYLCLLILVCMLYATIVETIHDEVKRKRKDKEDALSVSTQCPTMSQTTNNAENAPE